MKRMNFIFSALFAAVMLASCTPIGNFIDDLDNPPEMTSPCVGLETSPCGPKRTPDQQWLMNHHGINITV